ncbi:major capsid protein [Phaeospirillum tilakii]|uniref:Major capsid protein n=1 Tax=Phaeospirillum tilakii TaxID=741673 RepID=A0ABW5CE31_9PROT
MATLVSTNPTLADLAKALDPDGSIAQVVEILSQVNEILDDMTFVEGNLPTGHRTTIRAGLPQPTWRKLYGGVQPTKSTRVQITDSCGMLEAYAEVDKALADLNGNTAAFRLSEDKAHIEGMSQEVAQTLFYGNEGTEPEAFTGLAPRYNSLSAENADNIVNAGGTGADNSSIWLVVWGPDTCHGIYPKGSQAGLRHKDLGEVTIEDVDGLGGRMQAYRTHYRWDVGLTLRDWRYVARIANIDVSDLSTLANTKNLLTWMIQASERIPVLGRGRACWYMNRTLREKLRLGIVEKIADGLSWETVAGKRVMVFDDIPVRLSDVLLNTETVVS